MFQFHSTSLLIAILLYHCSNLYNNNYNYNSLSDKTIHNCNSSVRYAAYNFLVTDKFCSLDSNTQLVLIRCCLNYFSLVISLFRNGMDGSCSQFLEKSFATVCIYVLSGMSFSYVHCCWLWCSMHGDVGDML